MDKTDLRNINPDEIIDLVLAEGKAVRKVEYQPKWDRKQGRYVVTRQAIRSLGQALGGVGPDITNITSTNVLFEVLGLVGPEYALRNICRVSPCPDLIGEVRVATKATANTDIGAGEESDLKKIIYAKVPINLRDHKDVYPALFLDEDRKQANTDLMGDAALDAALALALSENTKIQTLIEQASAVAGGDWGSVNPIENIQGAVSTIEDACGYEANRIAAHPYVWADYFGSSYVRGLYPTAWPSGKVFPVPGCPGMTGIKDNSMTNTIAVVAADRAAFVHADGPTEAEQFRLPMRGADVYLIRHWNQPYQAVSTAAIKLTGVHA